MNNTLVITGLLMTAFGLTSIDQLPPGSSWVDYMWITGFTILGVLVFYFGIRAPGSE